ncbi:cation diffusion facilitator family transporter [Planctomicrobium sp. SH527]|uniref:cation diffusion facilitator family transporter n=1 Tax=Planctomicrobium sp. SH527 TaxID=3448123 RepID=UPI003F5C2D6C
MITDCQHHVQPVGGSPSHVRRLWTISLLVVIYCIAEIVGGIWTGSLALLADAGHMVSDLTSLLISLFAAWLTTRRPSSPHQTFGFHRAEILAALINGSLLFLVAGGILHEAWDRLSAPTPILALPMLAIAGGGLLVNLVSLSLLHGHHHENLNMRGVWLHLMGDTLGSVAVIAAAVLIWAFGWTWADPVASILACLLILVSAWRLTTDAMRILMEYAPKDVDVDEIRAHLMAVPEVQDVHCLHVWTIASGLKAMSAHVVVSDVHPQIALLPKLQESLRDSFSIDHMTIQIEKTGGAYCSNGIDGACLMTHPVRHRDHHGHDHHH